MKTIAIVASTIVLTLAAVFAVQTISAKLRPKSALAPAAASTAQPKQLWTCGMHPQVIQDHPGFCPICHMRLVPLNSDSYADAGNSSNGQRKILYYWDPMLGPSSIAHAPGKSAMGMDLVPVYEDEQSGGPTVKIDPTIVQNMGVRTAEVSRGPLEKTVRTVGMLEVPEPGQYEINLKISGWIKKLYANQEGMHVHKGEPLFDLYSPDLLVAEEELIGAIKSLKSLRQNAPDTMRSETEDLVDSAKEKLRLWDVADQDIEAIAAATEAPETIPFRSPTDGHVLDKMVIEGSAVQAGMKVMRIEDHTNLWLVAQVYEDDIPLVALGQTVEATVDGVPGKTYTGPITFIYPHLDHMTRTAVVRVTFDNPNHELSPGMYATANILTQPVSDAVLVPREAVIDTGTRQIAFVALGEGHFEPRKVRMGVMGDDDRVQILEGLAPGEIVVTSGQFLLDVESRTTEAIDKLRQSSANTDGQALGTETQTTPSTASAISVQSLVIVHCPMKNADWLQRGEVIANPYLGTAMPTCGEISRTIAAPLDGSSLDELTKDYLVVSQSLDADSLDAEAVQALKSAAEKLPNDQFAAIQSAAAKLAAATHLDEARLAFEAVSAELIRALPAESSVELLHPINQPVN
jgi:Cu(I)/Ag(I) efflux system membrane fusion protein/cobalt-zinc-cadmium efflux system membrane fusion protein